MWENAWAIIAAMEGLQNLWVTLSGRYWAWSYPHVDSERFLNPLRKVRNKKVFEIEVPRINHAWVNNANDPFRLKEKLWQDLGQEAQAEWVAYVA